MAVALLVVIVSSLSQPIHESERQAERAGVVHEGPAELDEALGSLGRRRGAQDRRRDCSRFRRPSHPGARRRCRRPRTGSPSPKRIAASPLSCQPMPSSRGKNRSPLGRSSRLRPTGAASLAADAPGLVLEVAADPRARPASGPLKMPAGAPLRRGVCREAASPAASEQERPSGPSRRAERLAVRVDEPDLAQVQLPDPASILARSPTTTQTSLSGMDHRLRGRADGRHRLRPHLARP